MALVTLTLLWVWQMGWALGTALAVPKRVWTGCESGAEAGHCSLPRGVVADPETGHIYVADQANDRVVELSAWGEFIRAWGWDVVASGPGNDISPPTDQFEICVPANGDECKAGSKGGGAGQFVRPQGIAIDGTGSIYVSEGDFSSRRIQKFDAAGHFVLMFGGEVNKTKVEATAEEQDQNLCPVDAGDVCQAATEGTGKGQFGGWTAGSFIAVDKRNTSTSSDDTVYVGDEGRVQRFDAFGNYVDDLPDSEGLLAGKKVQSLAIDPSGGGLYLSLAGQADVLKLDAIGKKICTLKVKRPSAIATSVGDDVWVVSALEGVTLGEPMQIVRFSKATCGEVERFNAEEEGFKNSTGIATNLCDGGEAPGNLYLTDTVSSFVSAYGTPPIACEPPPLRAPDIVEQFATSVGPDNALVRAKINPHFWDKTTFLVEFGTSECATGSCERHSPVNGGIALGGGITQDPITSPGVWLLNLQPSTTYHYRFVAQSNGGGPEYGTRPKGAGGVEGEASIEMGLEGSFRTPPFPSHPKTDCPNQALRNGSAAHLPDCRAFEMVSPIEKNGGGIETLLSIPSGAANLMATLDESSNSGSGLTYAAKQAFGDAIGAPYSSQYLARRNSVSGWATHSLNAPNQNFPGGVENTAIDTEFKAFSEDLTKSWMIHQAEPPLAPCAPMRSSDLYRRDNSTDIYEALHCESNLPFVAAPGAIELLGVSANGCRAVFRSNSRLTADAAGPFPVPPAQQPYQIYESSCEGIARSEGPLRLVSELPSGKPCEQNSAAGSIDAFNQDTTEGRGRNAWHAFSADAHRLYWSCGKSLYLRTDPDLLLEGDEETVKIGGPVGLEGIEPLFQAASTDGGRALLIGFNAATSSYLLREYDATAALPTLSTIAGKIEDGSNNRVNIMGVSDDASRVYFVSREELATTPNGNGDKANVEQPNLYMHDGAGTFHFVGSLATADLRVNFGSLTPVGRFPFHRASRVSADGLHAVFTSSASITGFDSTDAISGHTDAEVFVYDATAGGGAGKVFCVSCNYTGARPTGSDQVGNGTLWTAAWIPGWQSQLYPGRPLSEDGRRLFFNSFEALVDRDTNGRQDVYEWEQVDGTGEAGEEECGTLGAELFNEEAGGCISLVSSGQDPEDSEFVDADKDGSDVFIRTGESLLPQDPGLVDLYDARVNGGFPLASPPPVGCNSTDTCQSPPAPPVFDTPASAASGPGDITMPEPRPCPKGKRKVRQDGKVRCVPRHRKGKPKTQRAHSHRRAAR